MRLFQVGLTIALALGTGVLATAQDRRNPGDGYYRDRPYQGYGYDNNGRYPDAQRGGDPAYRIGIEDGRRDGERDLVTRHSFRPTHGDNYRHADRGYHRSFGDKRYYKDQYRAGYMQGYQTGYNSSGYYRR